MKRKTIMLSAMFVLAFISLSQAQKFYLGAMGGYGLGALKTTYEEDKYTSNTSGYSSTTTSKSYSLGQGINTGLFVGYMFNNTLGAELNASYLIGNKFSFRDTYNNPGYSSQEDYTLKANMIRLTPCLRIQFGTGKLSGYTKTGLIVGLATKVKGTDNDVNNDFGISNTTYSEWEYSGGLSLGFHGALGARYSFGKMGVFCELAANLQNWAMKKGTMKVYKENGVDMLNSLPVSEKQVEFKDEYTETSNDNNSKPSQASKMYLPFSSLGLNIGLQFAF